MKWKRAQQDCIHYPKHGCAGSNSQSEHRDRERRETGILAELAERVTKVL
jgi:hypothetical protein